MQAPFQPRIAAIDREDHPGLSEKLTAVETPYSSTEASMSARPLRLRRPCLRPRAGRPVNRATRLPCHAWRCSHSRRNGAKPSRENRARTPAMTRATRRRRRSATGDASLWLAMSVAGPPIRFARLRAETHVDPDPHDHRARSQKCRPSSRSISRRACGLRNTGHSPFDSTPSVPKRSSAFAAPTATARLNPQALRHPVENATELRKPGFRRPR